jgi:hypothetical protein
LELYFVIQNMLMFLCSLWQTFWQTSPKGFLWKIKLKNNVFPSLPILLFIII